MPMRRKHLQRFSATFRVTSRRDRVTWNRRHTKLTVDEMKRIAVNADDARKVAGQFCEEASAVEIHPTLNSLWLRQASLQRIPFTSTTMSDS